MRCAHESAGKVKGVGGKKIGNAHLKWAFSEAACLLLRGSEPAKKWLARREKKHGKAKAPGASWRRKLGRTVYHLLRKQRGLRRANASSPRSRRDRGPGDRLEDSAIDRPPAGERRTVPGSWTAELGPASGRASRAWDVLWTPSPGTHADADAPDPRCLD